MGLPALSWCKKCSTDFYGYKSNDRICTISCTVFVKLCRIKKPLEFPKIQIKLFSHLFIYQSGQVSEECHVVCGSCGSVVAGVGQAGDGELADPRCCTATALH